MISGWIYPHDLPGAIARALPTMRNKMLIANAGARVQEVMVDFDESGLVAIHESPNGDDIPGAHRAFSVTHVPTGVRFHYQPMPLADALDFANWLVARLDAIRALKLDHTQVNELNQPTIIADPGKINEAEKNWRKRPRRKNADI